MNLGLLAQSGQHSLLGKNGLKIQNWSIDSLSFGILKNSSGKAISTETTKREESQINGARPHLSWRGLVPWRTPPALGLRQMGSGPS